MAVPLDLKHHESNGTSKPALNPGRMEKMLFVRYSCPPSNVDDRGQYDMWFESINYLCDDLHWLLQQPHDKFWCQVVFDETLHKALDSFLRYCPRSHSEIIFLRDSGKQKHLELCRLVFMTFLRMSTHKESKDSFITPSVFGEILYANFLFDIPKIFDICSLFGKSNGSLLTKMIGNIFTQQPNYTDDLSQTIPTIVQVFNNIASQCGLKLDSSSMLSPQKLDNPSSNFNISKISIHKIQDLVMYMNDIGTTLFRFLEIYPEGCKVFNDAQFCPILANFYETVTPVLTDCLKQKSLEVSEEIGKLLALLRTSKTVMVKLFHLIVNHVCLLPVLENGTDIHIVSSRIEEFLHIMTSILNEKRFLAAHEGIFSFQDDVDLLLQATNCVDASQFEYIQSAINSAFATFGRRKSPHGDINAGGRTSPDGAPDLNAASNSSTKSATSSSVARNVSKPEKTSNLRTSEASGHTGVSDSEKRSAAFGKQPSDVEIESLICAVKDILPHLGDGYIEAALEELDWNQERVISCVLEDSLPQSLAGLSLDMSRHQRIQSKYLCETENLSLVDSRKNIFDHDEFDTFHNKNVKIENIHQGKKKVIPNLKEKEVNDIVKSRFGSYGSWERQEPEEDLATLSMYDDEYDDTYDTTNIGADDADSADELCNRTMPRVLRDMERKKAKMEGRLVDNESDDRESEEEDNNGEKRDEFVQDPAKLREQAAQQKLSQAASRGRRGPVRNFDVKGASKGQGQSKEVVNNRRSKEKFKGQRHRASAEKKMSKGMF